VSRRLITIAAVLAGVTAAPAGAATQASGPSSAQIRAALATAERSGALWATVNICNTSRHRDVIGIRAQQPALGFSSTLFVRIEVEYWSGTAYRPDPAPGATKLLRLGTASGGSTRQAGWSFQFGPHAGTLRGLVRYQWVHGSRVLGSTTRVTTQGHNGVRYADPPGYSAAKCAIR
jgi:hypothetical protein